MVDILKESPDGMHPQVQGTLMYRKHNLDGVYFMDAWPAMKEPQIVVCDPVFHSYIHSCSCLCFYSSLSTLKLGKP